MEYEDMTSSERSPTAFSGKGQLSWEMWSKSKNQLIWGNRGAFQWQWSGPVVWFLRKLVSELFLVFLEQVTGNNFRKDLEIPWFTPITHPFLSPINSLPIFSNECLSKALWLTLESPLSSPVHRVLLSNKILPFYSVPNSPSPVRVCVSLSSFRIAPRTLQY